MSPLSLVLERYLNILVPPPPHGPNECVTCRRSTEGFERCLQCNRHFQAHGQQLADEIVPSSQGRTSPLVDVLGRRLGLTRNRFADVLTTSGENTRLMRPERYG